MKKFYFLYDYISLMWLYVLLKMIDIITTIIGVEYLGLVEMNFLGYFNVVLFSIFTVIVMIHFIRLFYNNKNYSDINSHNISKFLLILLLLFLFCVSINNILHIIITIIVN